MLEIALQVVVLAVGEKATSEGTGVKFGHPVSRNWWRFGCVCTQSH